MPEESLQATDASYPEHTHRLSSINVLFTNITCGVPFICTYHFKFTEHFHGIDLLAAFVTNLKQSKGTKKLVQMLECSAR